MYWKIQTPTQSPQFHKISKEGEQKNTEQESNANHIPSSNHYQQIFFPTKKSFFLPIPCFDDDAHV
jgi:hypothetical protein